MQEDQVSMRSSVLCAAVVLSFAIVPISGRAADTPAAFAQIAAAVAGVTSFRVTTTVTFNGFSMTSVATVQSDPFRMHAQTTPGRNTSGTYTADGFSYQEIAPGRWSKMPVPASSSDNDLKRVVSDIQSANAKHAPDIVDGGKPYAVFVITSASAIAAGQPLVTTCTIDEASWLPHTCKSAIQTETFDRFNDPDNAVVVPPAALAAPAGPPLPPLPPGR